MTQPVRIESGAHVAVLDALRGAGVLVTPDPSTDITLGGGDGLHAADWDSITRRLIADGWTFYADEWDLPVEIGYLPNGSVAHGLYPAHEDNEPISHEDEFRYKLALLDLMKGLA
ncbi:hypothetical protein QI633_07840 [Nocardioides sp. QY071]|uniref:hypothetical protein n=1 Tax=Nocardioides sp. QY071 TaxID=3044187 RepID=UPI00249B7AD4|nr:hypothetical protein [Nocardioides sp. QY071]WGY03667.1 hypothetical protein QI633_07840 [Nocardioides sp. QY071]